MRYKITSVLLVLCYAVLAQVPAKRYKWKQLGPIVTPPTNASVGKSTAVGMGWVQDLLVLENEWYAGSISGGLYKTTNAGKRWKKTDTDTLQMGTLCLLSVGDTIYRGTGLTHYDEDLGVGLLYSVNKGKTWEHTSLKFDPLKRQPLWDVDADGKGKMIACTPTAIYYTTAGSSAWEEVYRDKAADFREVLIDASGSLWVCGNRLMHSTDGINWEDKSSRLTIKGALERVSIAQDLQNTNRFLAFYGEQYNGVIDQSYDGGKTWSRLYASRKVSRADIHHTTIGIAPDDSNTIVLGTYRAYISTDGGKSFEVATTPRKYAANFAHDDIRNLYVLASNDIYLCTDGGVFHSIDTGKTWDNRTGKGLTITQILGMHLMEDESIVMGCQDLGFFQYKKKKWTHLGDYYGDGGDAIETRQGINILLSGRMKKINAATLKGSRNIHPRTSASPFTARLVHYPGALDTFYYLGTDVWKIAGDEKLNLTKDIDGKKEMVSGFDINLSKPNQIFFSYNQPTWSTANLTEKLYKSEDGGKSWTDLTTNLPILAWRNVTGIATQTNKHEVVIVSLGKMDDSEVYKAIISKDGGLTWENYSHGLPPYETFGIWPIPNSTGFLLSSLEGLFYRNDGMEAWIKLEGKVPSVPIRDIGVNLKSRKIYAATYGSGLWYLKIPKKMLNY